MDTTMEDAREFFAEYYFGDHHIPSPIKPFGQGWMVYELNDISTFDFDNMTRLVFLAHDRCFRASCKQHGPGRLAIIIHKRKRTGNMCERHPTLEEAVSKWKMNNPVRDSVTKEDCNE